MMYIQGTAAFGLGYATELTLIVVAAACLSRLTFPVWSIVRRMAATPAGIVFACPILCFPMSKTGHVAKRKFVLSCIPVRAREFIAAISTYGNGAALPSWRPLSYIATNICCGHAFTRAVIMRASIDPIGRAAMKALAAVVALYWCCLIFVPCLRITNPATNIRAILSRIVASFFFCSSVAHWFAPFQSIITQYVIRLGIGSEAYVAVKMGRRAIGAELKPSYWNQAVGNLRRAELEKDQPTLLDLMAYDEATA